MRTANKEMTVSSISIQAQLPLGHAVEKMRQTVGGQIAECQIALNESSPLSPGNFLALIQRTFFLQEALDYMRIPHDFSPVDPNDLIAAQKFGYKLISLASVKVTDEGLLAAWMGTTLVQRDHPLATGIQLHIDATKPIPIVRRDSAEVLLPERKIVAAHYIRLTVNDEHHVLSHITGALGDKNINIHQVEQPASKIVPEGQPIDIGLLLKPNETGLLHDAVSAIRQQPYCLTINALYRVLGDPVTDLASRR